MATSKRFKQFLHRYEKKSYGTPIDQPLADPRLDTGLDLVGRSTDAHFIPNSLPADTDEAVVMAVLSYSGPHMSSQDPKLGIISNVDKEQAKMLDLKCYVLSRPMCAHISKEKISTLEPKYVNLLPTFRAIIAEGERTPTLGDIVSVKYDSLAHTKGEFIKVTGLNISDMLSENSPKGSLKDKFRSNAKKTDTSAF